MEDSSLVPISTDNGRHNYLENLPDLVYYHLFKYLHAKDLMNLRLVSEPLYSFVMAYDIKELNFVDDEDPYMSFSFAAEFVKVKNVFNIYWNEILLSPLSNFLNLKDLKIYSQIGIKLKDLNKFTKLENLRICYDFYDYANDDLLQLPNLKKLNIQVGLDRYYDDETAPSVLIDTPNLQELDLYECYSMDCELVKFKRPESVKSLIINYHENIQIFSNLECLQLHLSGLQPQIVNKLPSLNHLKKLRFVGEITNSESESQSHINELKNLYRSKKDNLEIVVEGVPIKQISKIDEIGLKRDKLEFVLDNYNKTEDDLHFILKMNYNLLVRLLPNQPADLFSKFANIELIIINDKIEDENRLIQFIKDCKKLNSLAITESSLGQSFFDQLPAHSQLTYLEIESEIGLNFEFIMKMPCLYCLQTNQVIALNENLNLNNLKNFKRLVINLILFIDINIVKHDDGYVVNENDELINFDQLCNYINKLRRNIRKLKQNLMKQ